MKYYIDFDNTLFDTETFYNDLIKVTEKYGITKNKINDYSKNELFNPIKIINKLLEKHKLKEQIKEELTNFFKDLSIYLYSDTLDFLEYLKNKDCKLILLSFGDYDYQNEKINKSGIKEYFDQIIITTKHKALLDLDYEHSAFIDDNKIELEGLLKTKAKVFRIKRLGNKHYSEKINDVLEFNDFNKLTDFIENNLFNNRQTL